MTNLLRKIFIKDYKNVTNPKVRHLHGILASFVGIFSNLLLFIFKIIVGILIGSMSIISDAINNLTDMAGCFVNLFGFKLANKPADKEHPFGHERIEYLAGIIISFIIIIIAVILGYSSVMKIISGEVFDYKNNVTLTIATFIILVVSILGKLWQGLFYRKIAKEIDSVSLKASAQDSLNDVVSTSAVLLATIVECILVFNNIYIQIDGYMGILVSLFIVIMGIKMVLESANPLIGEAVNFKLVKQIEEDILKYEGVLGIHDVMAHSYGPSKIYMTIHVEVDYKIDIMQSHDLMDNIENDISKKYNVILTVHMDPIVTDSEEVNQLKDYACKALKKYHDGLSLHDFRIVAGPSHTNILFDVVIPFETQIKENELLNYLKEEFTKLDKKYFLVLKFDNDYVSHNCD